MRQDYFVSYAKIFCLLSLLFCATYTEAIAQESMTTDSTNKVTTITTQPQAIVLGCISSKTILKQMPQYKAVEKNIASLREQYETEAKKSERDFQTKFEEFMQGQKDFHKTILEKRQNELQNMLETNAAFRIKVQKLLTEAETEMLANVMAEMQDAIALAAEENGVSIVFDTDGNSVPFIVKGVAIDLTPSVLKILGVNQ